MSVDFLTLFGDGLTAGAVTEGCAILLLVASIALVWVCRPNKHAASECVPAGDR